MREEDGASGIEIEGELVIAERACLPKPLHSLAGSFSQTMGFEPFPHPDVTAFGIPDFGEFEGAATTRTLKRVTAKAVFALTASDVLEGGGE
jgi:hypothetical protein